MLCGCEKLLGYKNAACTFYVGCLERKNPDTPKPDTEALFKKFIDEFPVLSALDVFCNPCGRPRAISYHKGDPVTLDGNPYHFYVMFSCNCPSQIAVCHHMVSRPFTRERIVEILRGE